MASTRGIALAVIAAVLAAIVTVAPVAADWPTSCVALNDLAEAAAGRPQNVGIYQRVAGVNAEAACQHDHRADVQATFAWALGGRGGAGHGVWPTSCVALNDLAEASIGNHGNVGIYQRIHVHDFAAESACRSDHRADVVRTFAWALPSPLTPAAPAAAGQPQPQTHRDYERVRQVAEARGASPAKADAVAASVVVRGQVDAFLRGDDAGVEYGLHACEWRNHACPLAAVYVSPEPPPASQPSGPRIDAGLQRAWDLIAHSEPGSLLMRGPNAQDVEVVWAYELPSHATAGWAPNTRTIGISPRLAGERPEALAAVIAHELWHAISPIPRPRTFNQCVADEVRAFIVQAAVWLDLWPGPPISDLEDSLERMLDIWLADPGPSGTVMEDVSGFPGLRGLALYGYNYATTCAA